MVQLCHLVQYNKRFVMLAILEASHGSQLGFLLICILMIKDGKKQNETDETNRERVKFVMIREFLPNFSLFILF